jgi:lysophospholipase L1-like esterase
MGLHIADKKDSTDLCFFAGTSKEEFLKNSGVVDKAGEFIDTDGKTVGKHSGYTKYVNGQRASIGGNKVYDLFLRMEDDVLSKKPDVVVIYVGVNDVWHKASYGTGTDADKFTKFYTALIKKMQSQGIKLILTTPAAIGEKNDHSNQQDGDLNQYSKIIRDLAKEHKCGLVDLRKEFLAYNLANNPENKGQGILTTDRVHLNEAGNKLVAELMFKELMK